MKFLFDNNLSPSWPRALAVLSDAHFGKNKHAVYSLRERFDQNTPDTEWLQALAAEGEWVVISKDYFRSGRGAEREIIRQSSLNAFVLTRSWQKYPFWIQTSQLVGWWPRIVQQAEAVQSSCFEVPWKLSSKFTQP